MKESEEIVLEYFGLFFVFNRILSIFVLFVKWRDVFFRMFCWNGLVFIWVNILVVGILLYMVDICKG